MQAGRTVVSQKVSVDSVVATRRLSGARLRAVGGRRKTLTRLLFDESLAELADELLLLDDEDVSAADAEAPRRNARIASLEATTPSFFSEDLSVRVSRSRSLDRLRDAHSTRYVSRIIKMSFNFVTLRLDFAF